MNVKILFIFYLYTCDEYKYFQHSLIAKDHIRFSSQMKIIKLLTFQIIFVKYISLRIY